MPQTSYLQNAVPAQPGMAFDAEASSRDVVSAIAAVNIPFGVLCEYNSSGLAVPVQDAVCTTTLAGLVTVTASSTAITFGSAQTLAKGTKLMFAAQPGAVYYLAAAISAGTSGTLTYAYDGITSSTLTAMSFFNPQLAGISLFDPLGVEQNYVPFAVPNTGAGSTAAGWLKGQSVPFLRRGRIWAAGDAGGTAVLAAGPINVWHSSTGANPQGVFTNSPAVQTAGGEIDVAPGCQLWNASGAYAATYTDPFGNTFKIYPLEINI